MIDCAHAILLWKFCKAWPCSGRAASSVSILSDAVPKPLEQNLQEVSIQCGQIAKQRYAYAKLMMQIAYRRPMPWMTITALKVCTESPFGVRSTGTGVAMMMTSRLTASGWLGASAGAASGANSGVESGARSGDESDCGSGACVGCRLTSSGAGAGIRACTSSNAHQICARIKQAS